MISDLQTDTSKLGFIDKEYGYTKKNLDTLLNYFGESITGNFSLSFYSKLSALNGFTNFLYTNRTIDQLKNSGSMRLIRGTIPIGSDPGGYFNYNFATSSWTISASASTYFQWQFPNTAQQFCSCI